TFIDTQTLPVSGTYTVPLDPTDANTGRATIKLYNVPQDNQGTITRNRAPVTVSAVVPGQNASLTFNGTAGQQISLAMTGVTIPSSWLTISGAPMQLN